MVVGLHWLSLRVEKGEVIRRPPSFSRARTFGVKYQFQSRTSQDEGVEQCSDLKRIRKFGKHSYERRDFLLEIEAQARRKWRKARAFQPQAEYDNKGEAKPKYFVTFPFPYMNGMLHLGHAFSLSKAEFAARFQRLLGKNVLFAFGFHCTGMPIQAAANRLREEIETYGCPPVFNSTQGAETRQWNILKQMVDEEEIPKFQNASHWLDTFPKMGVEDLRTFGAGVDYRRSFITTDKNPYFDSFVRWQISSLKRGGRLHFGQRPAVFSPKDNQVCADHDRSSGEGVQPQKYLILKFRIESTDLPTRLQTGIKEGLKVYLCAATLRPETYHGVTGVFVSPRSTYNAYQVSFPEEEDSKNDQQIWILSHHAARNLLHQGLSLSAISVGDSGDSAEISEGNRDGDPRGIKGGELVGIFVQTQANCSHKKVPVYPLDTISLSKGTGIVSCVPGDSPDDYVAIKCLNKTILKSQNTTSSLPPPLPFSPTLHVEGYMEGGGGGETACKKFKINSAKDVERLREAREALYLAAQQHGTVRNGRWKDFPAVIARKEVSLSLQAIEEAWPYYEPEKEVKSRTGDICVVALCDQWYISYGDPDWLSEVENHIKSPNFDPSPGFRLPEPPVIFGGPSKFPGVTGDPPRASEVYGESPEISRSREREKGGILGAVRWLGEWACSRRFGLGTKIPWDTDWVVDSLSDSTIYMAYYTVAHFLHGENNLDGSRPTGDAVNEKGWSTSSQDDESDERPRHFIPPHQFEEDVWEYIFHKDHDRFYGTYPKLDKLMMLRDEFQYWYPVDLRVSGKDLLRNHLAMCLYNHAQIWRNQPEMWPRAFRTNGHLLLNNQKMSKSTGNFLLLREALEKFGADAVRLALADAGDALEEDANFNLQTADKAVLRLYNLVQSTQMFAELYRSGKLRSRVPVKKNNSSAFLFPQKAQPSTWFERGVSNEGDRIARKAKLAYHALRFRDALHWSLYEMQLLRDLYTHWCKLTKTTPDKEVSNKLLRLQCIMVSPICPHTAERMYEILENSTKLSTESKSRRSTLAMDGRWPVVGTINSSLAEGFGFLRRCVTGLRDQLNRLKNNKQTNVNDLQPFAQIHIVSRPSLVRVRVIEMLVRMKSENGRIPDNCLQRVRGHFSNDAIFKGKLNEIMQVAAHVKDRFNEGDSSALQLGLGYNQRSVLEHNREYLQKSLNLEGFEVVEYTGTEKKGRHVPTLGFPTISIVNRSQRSS
ncbi:hypothetical protein AAMO2058_001112200 [Amorphochlora amoebiformis]